MKTDAGEEDFFSSSERPRKKFDAFAFLANPMQAHDAARRFRQLHDKPVGANFGCAFVLAGGQRRYVEAYSKGRKPCTQASAQFKGLTMNPSKLARVHCSEFQILNHLGTQLKNDTVGAIDLYTENAPCESCGEVIRQFLSAFPRMHMGVMFELGPGDGSIWPDETGRWEQSIEQRLKTKRFTFSKIGELFIENAKYAFTEQDGNRTVYRFLGYRPRQGAPGLEASVWQSEDGVEHVDLEMCPRYPLIERTGRNSGDQPLPESGLARMSWDPQK